MRRDDLFQLGNYGAVLTNIIRLKIDVDRCRAAVALDAGSTAPFWASQNLRLWKVFTQLRCDNLGIARDIAMSNNDSAAGVDDMLGRIFANDVRPAFDSADKCSCTVKKQATENNR